MRIDYTNPYGTYSLYSYYILQLYQKYTAWWLARRIRPKLIVGVLLYIIIVVCYPKGIHNDNCNRMMKYNAFHMHHYNEFVLIFVSIEISITLHHLQCPWHDSWEYSWTIHYNIFVWKHVHTTTKRIGKNKVQRENKNEQ